MRLSSLQREVVGRKIFLCTRASKGDLSAELTDVPELEKVAEILKWFEIDRM